MTMHCNSLSSRERKKITLDDATFTKAKTTLGKAQASNILRKYDNALMKRCQVSYDVKRGLEPLPTEMSEDTSLMSYSVFLETSIR